MRKFSINHTMYVGSITEYGIKTTAVITEELIQKEKFNGKSYKEAF